MPRLTGAYPPRVRHPECPGVFKAPAGNRDTRQIDVICAPRLVSVKEALAVHIGGSVRATPDKG